MVKSKKSKFKKKTAQGSVEFWGPMDLFWIWQLWYKLFLSN